MTGRPTAVELVSQGTGFLHRTDLAQLGLGRRAIDAIFRSCPPVLLPGHGRPLIRVEDYLAIIESSTYRDERVRPVRGYPTRPPS